MTPSEKCLVCRFPMQRVAYHDNATETAGVKYICVNPKCDSLENDAYVKFWYFVKFAGYFAMLCCAIAFVMAVYAAS